MANQHASISAAFQKLGRSARRALATVVAGLLAAQCGGGNSGPAAPTAPSPPAAPILSANTVPDLRNGNSVTFTLSGSATGITNWVVQIGRSSGQSDVATLSPAASQTTFTVRPLPIGVLYARAYAQGAAGKSPASAEVVLGSYDPREIIDAVLMGSGPMAVAGNVGCRSGVLEGWQWGTTVRIQTTTGLSVGHLQAAADTAVQIARMTTGQVNAFVESVGDPGPGVFYPGLDTIFIRQGTDEEVRQQCRCTSCVGCATSYSRGSFKAGVYVQVTSSTSGATVSHEIGHGVGLCHIISAAGFNPPLTMGVTTDGVFSPSGRLGRIDDVISQAMETVYAAGAQAGDTRSRLASLGLLPPGSSSNSAGKVAGPTAADPWAMIRKRSPSEISRLIETWYGKGSRIDFADDGMVAVTKLFCERSGSEH